MEEEAEGQGLAKIGSLAQKIGSSLKIVVSTPETCSGGSEITGSRSQAQTPRNSTGLQRGAIGAVDLRTIDRLDADAVGRALRASLPPALSSSLKESVDSNFDLVGYEVVGPIDPAEARQALALMDEFQSDNAAAVIKAATICLTVTASREREFADIKMLMAALMDGTKEFPADVVVTAFRRWQKVEKWWPALSEIRSRCLEEMRWRRSLRRILEKSA